MLYHDYPSFLASPRWAALREAALLRDGGRCRICNRADQLEVHHRRYRRTWDETRVGDLTTLCHACHERYSAYLPRRSLLDAIPARLHMPLAIGCGIILLLLLW